ncbi:MAG: hypothetical protein JO139_11550 [Alphaproteobacteria bacterium]|nr:hypothetical protein [Alphaproteobacteria bacterium]
MTIRILSLNSNGLTGRRSLASTHIGIPGCAESSRFRAALTVALVQHLKAKSQLNLRLAYHQDQHALFLFVD